MARLLRPALTQALITPDRRGEFPAPLGITPHAAPWRREAIHLKAHRNGHMWPIAADLQQGTSLAPEPPAPMSAAPPATAQASIPLCRHCGLPCDVVVFSRASGPFCCVGCE